MSKAELLVGAAHVPTPYTVNAIANLRNGDELTIAVHDFKRTRGVASIAIRKFKLIEL